MMQSLSPQVISKPRPVHFAYESRAERAALPKSLAQHRSSMRVHATSDATVPTSAPAIAPPKGRNLDWRQGLGALKNLAFMPMWHNTHDKLNQFFAMQDIPRGANTWDWPLAPLDAKACTLPEHASLQDFLVDQQVDSFALLHAGELVEERYLGDTGPQTRHSLASMSRTLTGAVAGILVDRRQLDLTSPLETWAPELASTAWRGVTVRNLLDMRSGITSSVPASLGAMGEGKAGLVGYLLGLQRDGEAGGPFKYRTSDTEMLAFMCQKVTGESMAGLWSRLLWQPVGASHDASVMVDTQGAPLCGGGVSATLRDTARFAQLLLQCGTLAQTGNATEIIPRWYIEDMRRGDADAKAAFGGMMIQLPLPDAMYRNQSWLLDADKGTSLLMGAGGQVAYLDPQNQFACLATSHWLMPYDAKRMTTWLTAFPMLRDQVLQARTGASH